MDSPERIIRRANVDDLPGLKLLWERGRLQVLELEKHLTEFQLVATFEGDLIGAIALQIDQKQGRLHSECYARAEQADDGRPWLWHRIQTLAQNHGLHRLWTLESSPFWHQIGFSEADPDLLKSLPEAFSNRHQRWLSLALRADNAKSISIEKEFELFQQAQRANTEQVLAQARKLKVLAYLLTLVVAAIAFVGFFFVFLRSPQTRPPSNVERAP